MTAGSVRYTTSGEQSLAYSVSGSGPIDIVFVSPFMSHVEVMVEPPQLRHLWGRFESIGRLILFDRRGAGLSDPTPGFSGASLEAWTDDLEAVLSAAGATAVSLFTFDSGAPYALMFAASHPEVVRSVALVEPLVPHAGIPGGPDYAPTVSELIGGSWGEGAVVKLMSPTLASDQSSLEWWARFERMSMSRGMARVSLRDFGLIDITDVVPLVQAPVLLMHSARSQPLTPAGQDPCSAHWLRDHLPRSEVVEVSHPDVHWWWDPELRAEMLDRTSIHFSGRTVTPAYDRVLATVMFTDLVGSTTTAARLGDRRWLDALQVHDALIKSEVERQRGAWIKSTGDGCLVTFDAPARAIRCAQIIRSRLGAMGLGCRIGIHTGEVERSPDDIAGLGVHIAARVMAAADEGEIVVSRTVQDLVVGSGISFEARGEHQLKGVPGTWELLAVILVD